MLVNHFVNRESMASSSKLENRNLSSRSSKSYISSSEKYSKSLSSLSLALKLACEDGRWSTTLFDISPSDASAIQSKSPVSDYWSKNISLATLSRFVICLIISFSSSLKNDGNDECDSDSLSTSLLSSNTTDCSK